MNGVQLSAQEQVAVLSTWFRTEPTSGIHRCAVATCPRAFTSRQRLDMLAHAAYHKLAEGLVR